LLYTRLATEIAKRGWPELLTVKWYGECRIYEPDSPLCQYFYEHPPGLFILPLLLADVGLPAGKTTLFADTIYQLVTLLGIYLLLRSALPESNAAAGILAVLLLPISFIQTLRASQETPMLMLLVIALLSIAQTGGKPWRRSTILFAIGAYAGLIKGLLVAPLLPLVAFAAWRYRSSPALAAGAVGAGAYTSLTIFEKIHLASTGRSFWLTYLDIQLWHRAIEPVSALGMVERTIGHGAFYLGCLAWYAAPWSLYLVWRLYKRPSAGIGRGEASPLGAIALCGTVLYILPLSFFARESMRYVFPAYYLTAVAALLQIRGRLPSRFHGAEAAAIFWCVSRCGVILGQSWLS
jgi:hypothetical protein